MSVGAYALSTCLKIYFTQPPYTRSVRYAIIIYLPGRGGAGPGSSVCNCAAYCTRSDCGSMPWAWGLGSSVQYCMHGSDRDMQ